MSGAPAVSVSTSSETSSIRVPSAFGANDLGNRKLAGVTVGADGRAVRCHTPLTVDGRPAGAVA